MIGIKLCRSIYRRSEGLAHGPAVWPWWRLVAIKVSRCTHDPYWFFWITPISWNVWIYTRWGARCINVRERDGVYRRVDFEIEGWGMR